MKMSKTDLHLFTMLGLTLVLPILLGFVMNHFSGWTFVSLPLHSTMESIGAAIAFILTAFIFMMYHKQKRFTHFHRAAFALISMGIFDLFHAIVYPGELFVWLHSLAIFFGGALFAFVWVPDTNVSPKSYIAVPVSVALISLGVVAGSMADPSLLPKMVDEGGEFTDTAILLNLIGGVMFVLSSLYFIRNYLASEELDDLLFAGHTMLFGSAGVLFFFSSLWDMQWWFWHALRLLAYIVSLVFMLKIFHRNLQMLQEANDSVRAKNGELTKSLRLLREYKNAVYSGNILSIGDLAGNIVEVNEPLLELTGYTREELIGKPHSIFRDPGTPKAHFKEMWETIQSGGVYKGLIKNRKKNNETFYVKITIVPIMDKNKRIFEYVAFREEVTELVESQSEFRKMFYTDVLTGLHNRYKLSEDLKSSSLSHIALLNIDNFKSINDIYGQEAGDEVLKKLSLMLLDEVYPQGYGLYRNHGDEFAITASMSVPFATFVKTVETWIKKIENTNLSIFGHTIELGLSAGMAEDTADIIKADMALKEAKSTKRRFVIYHDNLQTQKQFESNLQWSKKIKEALADDRIEIVLQPIYSNTLNRIVKYEALIRLIDESGEVISPFAFLEVAKRTRLYPQLTRRVIKKTFQLLPQTTAQISINLTSEDILDEEIKLYLINMIRTSAHAGRLGVELVESEGIENFPVVKTFLEEIKGYGVRLSIDDFGTGYSNFEYLLKLDADTIKIDGSLIKNIDSDPNSYNVVETIVAFAKKNDMEVVAEFVATDSIQAKVVELGIEYSQGYFIDKPKFWREIG
jgi:diguanylate cyclase (GGDEF)-like protein/PAS domain S-box-containing protein